MKKSFDDFCSIIKRLREPGGCPWDREQTHDTLKKHLLEEAYEAYDAITDGDSAKMADELGDVLLQVVMHAQIGSENGEFDINDVINAVSMKMITRHPHVFGDAELKTSGQVLDRWEEIKKSERGQHTASAAMEGITRSLPALSRCYKIISKAEKAGYDVKCNETPDIFFDLNEPEDEIGKALFDICTISHRKGIDPEVALASFTKKFIKKIKNIEENT